MERRLLLAGIGTGAVTVFAGCSQFLFSTDSPNHLVRISNGRETSHNVFVELEIDEEEHEYGPKTVDPGDDWGVERIESTGTLTVRVYVDDERIWDNTHEIPTPGENRRSFAHIELQPDGEVLAFVEEED